MKLGKIISRLFLLIDIAVFIALSSCLLIAEVWIAAKTDEYRYPEIEIMDAITVKAGESVSLPTYELSENESVEFIVANPELISVQQDNHFLCNSCMPSSIYLYIREKEIPTKELRYQNLFIFDLDISAFLNRIYYRVRDSLDIELMKERTEIRTLRILQYPVICDELDDSRITRISPDNICVQDSLVLDVSLDKMPFEIAEYDKSIIETKTDDSGKIVITALEEGTVSLVINYYTEISIYR